MNWKVLLAIFITIGIGVMLLRTEGGMSYATKTFDFLKVKVGNFVASLSGKSAWTGQGEGFRISMVVDKSSFLDQTFDIAGSDLAVTGIVQKSIKIGDVEWNKENAAVELDLKAAKGKFEYTVAGTVSFAGSAQTLIVDNNVITPSGGELKVSFEIVPIKFSIANVSERKITLESAVGSIARLNPDGSIKSTEQLASEHVEISKFIGSLVLEGPNVKMDGVAASVRGLSPQGGFSW